MGGWGGGGGGGGGKELVVKVEAFLGGQITLFTGHLYCVCVCVCV